MTLQLGQEFMPGSAATAAVKAMATAGNFSVRVPVSTGSVKTIKCTGEDCPFFVTLHRRAVTTPWFVHAMVLEHVNCTSTRKPTARQLAAMTTVQSAIRANPKIPIKAITTEVQGNDGINLQAKATQYKLYRARVLVREEIEGKYIESYHRIRPFLDAFATANPGSTAVAEAHDDGSFRRACIIPRHMIEASHKNPRVVCVDGAHSHHPIYDGKQLLYVGVDGDGKTVTLAIALVEGETSDDYTWFFSHIQAAGLLWDVPVFADRSSGLLSSVESTWLHLMHCTAHIIRNLESKFKDFNQIHADYIWAIQAATTKDTFERRMVDLGIASYLYGRGYLMHYIGEHVFIAAEIYVREIPPAHWAAYPAVEANVPLYGWRTSNLVESENGATLVEGIREQHPYGYLCAMVNSMVDDAFQRHEQAAAWTKRGLKVTPRGQDLLDEANNAADAFSCKRASTTEVYVSVPNKRWRVDVDKFTCTCAHIVQYRTPCCHLVAALKCVDSYSKIYEAFGEEYKVSTYSAAYLGVSVALPVDYEDIVDPTMLPSTRVRKRKRGPTGVARKRSKGE